MSNTILLIEDNLDCARLVRKVLSPLGYSVEHAATGAIGLQLARERQVKDLPPVQPDPFRPEFARSER